MKKMTILTLSVLASLLITGFPVWAETQHQESEHLYGKLQIVRIGRVAVVPETMRLKADENVAWINYASTPVQIRFSHDTVKKILCREPTPFTLAEDAALTAREVRPFGVVSLCHFLPGDYSYTVQRLLSGPRGGVQRSVGHLSVTAE